MEFDFTLYDGIFEAILGFGALSMPLVVVLGICERVCNALLSMLTGGRRVSL